MSTFLDRIDSVSLAGDDFSFEFNSWLSVLIDTLNETIRVVQDRLNQPQLQAFTQAEIVAAAANSPDGSMWYCSDSAPPAFVGKVNGALVQFTTAAFP
jgi:hypothetical protein